MPLPRENVGLPDDFLRELKVCASVERSEIGALMHLAGSTLQLAAYDLGRFLSCRHCTALDMEVANGNRPNENALATNLKARPGNNI